MNTEVQPGFRFLRKCNPKDKRSRDSGTSKQANIHLQLRVGHRRTAAKYQHSLLLFQRKITLLTEKRTPAHKKKQVHVESIP